MYLKQQKCLYIYTYIVFVSNSSHNKVGFVSMMFKKSYDMPNCTVFVHCRGYITHFHNTYS